MAKTKKADAERRGAAPVRAARDDGSGAPRGPARSVRRRARPVRADGEGPGVKGKAEKVSDKDFQKELQEPRRASSRTRRTACRARRKSKSHKARNRVILLTGVTLGVLYNPWTGQATRDWIMERVAGGERRRARGARRRLAASARHAPAEAATVGRRRPQRTVPRSRAAGVARRLRLRAASRAGRARARRERVRWSRRCRRPGAAPPRGRQRRRPGPGSGT